jgi:hypothetical protein
MLLTPILFLSGSWTPPEAMPVWMRLITYLSPLKYYLTIAYGILLKEAGLVHLWLEFAGMTALGLLLFETPEESRHQVRTEGALPMLAKKCMVPNLAVHG